MELIKELIKKCNKCGLDEGLVRFCENRRVCNICRRKTKNINPDYNHNYYLLNKEIIAKQQKQYRDKKKCNNNLINGI